MIRFINRHVHWGKFFRYAAVSGVSTVVSQTVLAVLVATRTTGAVWANIIATIAGTIPSFELNRRWVWGKSGQRSLGREMIPFAALSATGLGLSTITVAIMEHFTNTWSTTGRTVSIQFASLSAFGLVWVFQFFILDKVLFKHNHGHGQPSTGAGSAPGAPATKASATVG
ncbi:MAG: hypothetical protein JWM34_4267 [Ilumatobacteraceae bacterium]|nr:hypothetical protein [Ilumatobacteraceae bacterium]